MSQNPYQPPAEEQVPASEGAAAFSTDAVRVVGSLARSMQIVALSFFVVAGVVVLVLVKAMFTLSVVEFAVAAALMIGTIVAAVWLRDAADRFNRGVLESDVGVLGLGFVSLRKYLILFGVIAIVHFAFAVLGMVSR